MRTQSEYESILDAEADSALSRPVGTRRDVQAAGAEARRRVVRKRDELVREISQLWKDGFKNLKEENDSMQRGLRAAHQSTDIGIAERLADMFAGVQK
ncbi:MAG: hypothetical protein V2A69_10615 [Pseudomonadota bacterium]